MTRLALVTGAASGIGRATALRLADHGHRVLAGVRRPDAPGLPEHERIETVRLDITDQADIHAVVERLGDGSRYERLVLVNNAGNSLNSLVELTPLDLWRAQLETNLLGHLALTQALLPALARAAEGRIVNVSSSATLLTSPMLGAYAAAKAALEAASDALRRELVRTTTKVVVVQPGAVRTGIWAKAGAGAEPPAMSEGQHARYDALIAAVQAQAARFATGGTSAEAAAKVVARAVESRRPRPYYRIGSDARMMQAMSRLLPAAAQDRVVGLLTGQRAGAR